jgi:hypothetical protein
MCHQPISIYTCFHHQKHKPSFCKYKFSLLHEVEPQYHNVKSACSACKDKPISPKQEKAELSEEESNRKKKLRKLRRRIRDFIVDGGWDGDVLEDTDIDEEE